MKPLNDNIKAIWTVILSAMLYALCIPCLKLLNGHIPEIMTGGLLYSGAGLGLLSISGIKKAKSDLKLTKNELPYALAMVILDIFAVICLVLGVSRTTGANVSLLANFELVATTLIAALFFKEKVSKQIFLAICLITAACIILSYEGGLIFNFGSLLVLLSCTCWGAENNCTKMMSKKDTRQITTIKGLFAGAGGVLIALIAGETMPGIKYIAAVMLLGFVSYGISVCLYIYAQRFLGAAKTGAINSFAPFFGVIFCFLFLSELTGIRFFVALSIMIAGSLIVIKETLKNRE